MSMCEPAAGPTVANSAVERVNTVPGCVPDDLRLRLVPVVEAALTRAGVVLPPALAERIADALAVELHRDLGVL
jgi:hypothetical protein